MLRNEIKSLKKMEERKNFNLIIFKEKKTLFNIDF
jgi:hypothetical protein